MKLPAEIELKILSYIEPNPVVYTRLAMVSKFYYSLFTSDEKWLALDTQDVKTGLFKHYNQGAWKPVLRICWSDLMGRRENFQFHFVQEEISALLSRNDLPYEDDSLMLLGLIRHYRHETWKREEPSPGPPVITTEHYARVAIGLNYHALELVDKRVLQECPDLVEYCAHLDPQCLNWLDGEVLVQHKELWLNLLSEGYDVKESLKKLLDFEYDEDWIRKAAKYIS